jgi:hypothetical protein
MIIPFVIGLDGFHRVEGPPFYTYSGKSRVDWESALTPHPYYEIKMLANALTILEENNPFGETGFVATITENEIHIGNPIHSLMRFHRGSLNLIAIEPDVRKTLSPEDMDRLEGILALSWLQLFILYERDEPFVGLGKLRYEN